MTREPLIVSSQDNKNLCTTEAQRHGDKLKKVLLTYLPLARLKLDNEVG